MTIFYGKPFRADSVGTILLLRTMAIRLFHDLGSNHCRDNCKQGVGFIWVE